MGHDGFRSGPASVGTTFPDWLQRHCPPLSEKRLAQLIIGLLGLSLVLIAATFYYMSRLQDLEQRQQERRIVGASVSALQRALVAGLQDYTHWDDAVAKLAVGFDPRWAAQNFGATLHDNFGFNSLVIGRDGRVLYGQADGVETAEPTLALLGHELAPLLEAARDPAAAAPPVTIRRGGDELFLVAADSVKPDPNSGVAPPPGPSAVVIFTKAIGPDTLAQWQDDFGLAGLSLAPVGDALDRRAAVDLYDLAGKPTARIVWTPQRPGLAALAWIAPAMAGALVIATAFAGLMLRERGIQRASRASEARFKAFASSTSDWFWEADQTQRVTWVSERFFEVTGFDRAMARDMAAGSGGSDASAGGTWQRHLADLAARRPYRDFVFPLDDRDGRRRMLSVSGVPRFGSDGSFLGYCGSGREITEEWEAQHARQEIQQRATFALESAGQWVWELDVATNRVWRSPQYKAALGFRDDELADEDEAWRIVHPEDRAALALDRLVVAGSDLFDLTYRLRHKDGRWRWVLSRGRVVARRSRRCAATAAGDQHRHHRAAPAGSGTARGQCAGRGPERGARGGAPRGRSRSPGQVRVPGGDEPRDPHADDRRPGHGRTAGRRET